MASILDDAVCQALNTGFAKEAAGAADSRTRGWDNVSMAIATAQVVNLGNPTVLTGQGIRMLNGTPTTAPLQAPEPQKAG
mgnify:CR=1 FL=1|jgi:hypothetical protein